MKICFFLPILMLVKRIISTFGMSEKNKSNFLSFYVIFIFSYINYIFFNSVILEHIIKFS